MKTVDMHVLEKRFDELLCLVIEEGEITEVTDGDEIIARIVPAQTKPDLDSIWTDLETLAAEMSRAKTE